MCKVPRRLGAAQKTIVKPTAKVQRLLDAGRATLGECANAANGKVMCGVDRRGNLVNQVVPEKYITKRLGKGWTLGECGGGMMLP